MKHSTLTDHFPISRETLSKFERYAELLEEWNQKFNLVAASTLPLLWQRHFLDSAQLFQYLPPRVQSLADIGSGAGFPGLVLAIMGVPQVHLIESIGKKASFLQAVVDDLKLPVTIHRERAEKLKLKVDVVTARAVGPLKDLLTYSVLLAKPDASLMFLKGQSIESELTEAQKSWMFDFDRHPSLSDNSGCVLIVRKPIYKNAATQQRRQRLKNRGR